MSGAAFGTGLILFYFLFYFCLLLIGNFRGSKNRGSMDPVHILIDPVHVLMDLVHGPGPWKGSMDQGSMFCTFPIFHLSLAARDRWFYVCFSPLFSGVFLNVICYSIKKSGNSVVVGFVLSSEVKN